jgi:hypothetical protein
VRTNHSTARGANSDGQAGRACASFTSTNVQAILEADQIEEMHGQPGDPRWRSAEADHSQVGGGSDAADRREVALLR